MAILWRTLLACTNQRLEGSSRYCDGTDLEAYKVTKNRFFSSLHMCTFLENTHYGNCIQDSDFVPCNPFFSRVVVDVRLPLSSHMCRAIPTKNGKRPRVTVHHLVSRNLEE